MANEIYKFVAQLMSTKTDNLHNLLLCLFRNTRTLREENTK